MGHPIFFNFFAKMPKKLTTCFMRGKNEHSDKKKDMDSFTCLVCENSDMHFIDA